MRPSGKSPGHAAPPAPNVTMASSVSTGFTKSSRLEERGLRRVRVWTYTARCECGCSISAETRNERSEACEESGWVPDRGDGKPACGHCAEN